MKTVAIVASFFLTCLVPAHAGISLSGAGINLPLVSESQNLGQGDQKADFNFVGLNGVTSDQEGEVKAYELRSGSRKGLGYVDSSSGEPAAVHAVAYKALNLDWNVPRGLTEWGTPAVRLALDHFPGDIDLDDHGLPQRWISISWDGGPYKPCPRLLNGRWVFLHAITPDMECRTYLVAWRLDYRAGYKVIHGLKNERRENGAVIGGHISFNVRPYSRGRAQDVDCVADWVRLRAAGDVSGPAAEVATASVGGFIALDSERIGPASQPEASPDPAKDEEEAPATDEGTDPYGLEPTTMSVKGAGDVPAILITAAKTARLKVCIDMGEGWRTNSNGQRLYRTSLTADHPIRVQLTDHLSISGWQVDANGVKIEGSDFSVPSSKIHGD